jgi:mono/diheme cytochrome c family protein
MKQRMPNLALAATVAAAAGLLAVTSSAQAPGQAVVGDAARGRPLFSDTFNCYACHGFDAQSGERRLVPMNYTQEGFITFVQNSPLPNMPPFPDASAQQLADIYAYIRTIPADAPAVAELPLLRDILDRKARAAAE